MRLSIIIPVYNTEAYLSQCIESIFRDNPLDTRSFEVICANDGSTDGSLSLLNRYSELHPNLRVLSQTNSGQGEARNNGLRQSIGNYVYFMDSDDFVNARNLFSVLTTSEENDLDLVTFSYYRCDEDGTPLSVDRSFKETKGVSSASDMPLRPYGILRDMPWVYLYKRSYLMSLGVWFTPRIYHEDKEFVNKVNVLGRRIMSVSVPVYYYRVRSGSTMTSTSVDHLTKRVADLEYVLQSMQEYISTFPVESRPFKEITSTICLGATSLLLEITRELFPESERNRLVERYLTSSYYPIDTRYSPIRHRLFHCAMNHPILLEYFVQHYRHS